MDIVIMYWLHVKSLPKLTSLLNDGTSYWPILIYLFDLSIYFLTNALYGTVSPKLLWIYTVFILFQNRIFYFRKYTRNKITKTQHTFIGFIYEFGVKYTTDRVIPLNKVSYEISIIENEERFL